MSASKRSFSSYADQDSKKHLEKLLLSSLKGDTAQYRDTMKAIGCKLGKILSKKIEMNDVCLVASTAEDADFLTAGVFSGISSQKPKLAVFWNHHHQVSSQSYAPIVHQYLEPGYEKSDVLIVVKSVLSGSCVVRANILALIESLSLKRIFIVAPVVHKNSENALKREFTKSVSSMFEFIYLAKDEDKDEASGEVKPGIGGQIYSLLGLDKQPVFTGYMPSIVQKLALSS